MNYIMNQKNLKKINQFSKNQKILMIYEKIEEMIKKGINGGTISIKNIQLLTKEKIEKNYLNKESKKFISSIYFNEYKNESFDINEDKEKILKKIKDIIDIIDMNEMIKYNDKYYFSFLGYWVNKKNELFIDLSLLINDENELIEIMINNNQYEYYDFDKDNSFNLNE